VQRIVGHVHHPGWGHTTTRHVRLKKPRGIKALGRQATDRGPDSPKAILRKDIIMQLLKVQRLLWTLIHLHIAAQDKFMSRTLYLRIERLYTYLQKDVRKIYSMRTG
jgi:hypothetical protein